MGGANLFVSSAGDREPLLQIGRRNIEAVSSALRRLGLPIVGEDVGGTYGRSVEFCIVDGRLRIRTSSGIVRQF